MPLISRRQFTRFGAAAVGAALLPTNALRAALAESGLKDAFKGHFLIGTALSTRLLAEPDSPQLQLIAREFNAITAENCMKWGEIHPEEEQWKWELPDRFVAFGEQHGMRIVGHTLVWHSQTPRYLFVDKNGAPVSAERLRKRMETHISTLVDRYRGRIAIWDVVNEAIEEDDKGWRETRWLKILGPSYFERAFQLAHEADPKAHLIYNDYNEHNPGRRKFLIERIRDMKRRGIPIHGVGFQGHIGLDYPDLAEYERSIQAVAAEGLRVHITELEIDVLPRAWEFTGAEISAIREYSEKLNPYVAGLPKEVEERHVARYREFFELLLKYRDVIDRVTFWGTHDGESWKNDFPVRGRTNYPLLFDRQLNKKAAYHALVALAAEHR
jgi:endo-1,4-beta-xylanase